MQFVFEQILQWQARQYLGLREGRGEHAGNDNQRRIGKSLIGPETNLVCDGRAYHLLAIIADTIRDVHNSKNQQFASLTITRLMFLRCIGSTPITWRA